MHKMSGASDRRAETRVIRYGDYHRAMIAIQPRPKARFLLSPSQRPRRPDTVNQSQEHELNGIERTGVMPGQMS